MYYLQHYNAMSGQWCRIQDDPKCENQQFDSALDALEARDDEIHNWDNDGVRRGCRVVDHSGNVIVYGESIADTDAPKVTDWNLRQQKFGCY